MPISFILSSIFVLCSLFKREKFFFNYNPGLYFRYFDPADQQLYLLFLFKYTIIY
jgi:hypothetical protein